MACPLKPEQQEALYIKVKKDLQGMKTFSIKPYLKSVYDLIMKSKNDPQQAVLIVQSVPDFINAVATDNQDLSDYLTDNGLDLSELNKLSKAFRRDIDNIIEDPDIITQENDIKLEVELDKEAKFLEVKEAAPITIDYTEMPLTPATIYATTGNEAKYRTLQKIVQDDGVNSEEAIAIQNDEKKRNIIDPRMTFYYDFIKNTLNSLKTTDKVHLTAIPVSSLSEDDLNPHDKDLITDGTDEDRIKGKKELDKSVALVVTDAAGNIIRFNDSFNPDPKGKIAYYPIKRIHRERDNSINYKRSGVQTPGELFKASKGTLSLEQAAKKLEDQASEIENITRLVLENPDNKITGVVIGGSTGYLPISRNVETKLSDIIFDKGFVVDIPNTKDKYIEPAIQIPGLDKNVPIRGNFLTQEDAEKLASVLVDDITFGSDPIIESDRSRIYASWLSVKEDGVMYFPDKNLIRIEGIILDTTDKEAAKDKIVKFLMAPRVAPGAKPVSASKAKGVLKWKKGDPIPPRGTIFLVERDGEYYWNNYRVYNARKDIKYINSLDFIIDKKGNKKLSDKETVYTDWIKDKFFTNAIPNAEKRLVSLNGYLEYSLPLNISRAVKPKKVSNVENHAEIARLESLNLLDPSTTEYYKSGLTIPHIKDQYITRLKNLEYLSKPTNLVGITQAQYDEKVDKINTEYNTSIEHAGKLRYKINLAGNKDAALADLKREYNVDTTELTSGDQPQTSVGTVTPVIDLSREWKGDLDSRPVYTKEGINTMRTSAAKPNEHFGNPWSEGGYSGTIKVDSISEAAQNYKDWLLGNKFQNVKSEQRNWILDQINKGKLDGATLLYAGKLAARGQGMHPTSLVEVVEQLRTSESQTNKPVSKEVNRIRKEYPKVVKLYEYEVPTEKLQELAQVKHEDIVPYTKGEPYDETIEKLYGEFAANYVGETNSELGRKEGEFLKNNPKFAELFMNDYLQDTRASGKTMQEYATTVLEDNVKLVDTFQLDLFPKVSTDLTAPKVLTLSDETRARKKEENRKRLEGRKFKLIYQKESDIKAAEEQIEKAKIWYQNHPLSKYIPFTEMFGIINTVNPDAVAHWTVDGITLFKGSDYSDLYHESWHGFTQLFLTKDEKKKMYNEARKAEGTFTDFKGKTVTFKNASELQLEEFFAEDFRKFMLTGKKTEAPVRRSIFQKLWNILKAIFGKLTVEEVALNKNSLKGIHELFDKLSVGDINERSYNQNNVSFNILFSGIQRVTPAGSISIGRSDSRQMVDLMDTLATEIAEESANGRSFLSEHDNLKDKPSRAIFYEDILVKLYERRTQNLQNLEYELSINSDPQLIDQLQNREELFKALVDSYGDPYDPDILLPEKGAIGYHFTHTRFLIESEIAKAVEDDILEQSESGSDYIQSKESFIRTGSETSLEKLAAPEIISMLSSIIDKNSTENGLGAKSYLRRTVVSNILSKALVGINGADKLYEKIVELANSDKTDYGDVYRQIALRLGDPSNGTFRSKAIWKKFQHWLDKVPRSLQQLNIHELETREKGVPVKHTTRFGIVSGKGKGVEQTWKNGFLTSSTTFMVKDADGYYLDLQKLVKHYGDSIPKNQRIEFLRDLGVDLSKRTDGTEYDEIVKAIEIDESVSKAKFAVDTIYDHIKWLAFTEDSKIRNIQDLYRKRMGKNGWEGRFRNLAKLEAKINPIIGHMSNTATGTKQYEISLHSSNSRVVAGINESSNMTDFTDPNGSLPYLSYLNPKRNFFTRDSIWMASIYDPITGNRVLLDKSGTKNRIETYNASGVSLIDKDGEFISGISLSDSDFVSKLIGDMYMFSQGSVAEGTRTADRPSTYLQHPTKIADPSTYLDNVTIHIHSGKHYVDIPYFLVRGGETESKGRQLTKSILFLKLKNELDRINYFSDPNLPEFEQNKITGSGKKYSEVGKEFVMFHGVLSEETKNTLKKINTTESLESYLRKNNPDLLASIEADMDKYLNNLVNNLAKKVRETKYPADKLVDYFTTTDLSGKTPIERYSVRPKSGTTYVTEDFQKALLDAYISNQWIHNAEEQAFFYGDPAIYKGAMDYVKRITGAPSTGDGILDDNISIDSLKDLGDLTPYANSDWFAESGETSPKETKQYNGILQTAVLQDPMYISIYTDQIKARIREEEEPILKASGRYTQEEINTLIDEMIDKTYGDITASDGEGIMSFDTYRFLSFLSKEGWSDEQEDLFMKIVNKKPFNHRDVILMFPPLKLQMFGALVTEGAPIMGFHKFALFPAIPTMFKGHPAEKLHNKMISQGMDYVLFKSASKSAYLGNNGKTDLYFTNKDNTQHAFTADDYTFTKNPIYTKYLKNQMSVAKDYKKLSTFASQFRRLIAVGLMSNGIPVDFRPDIKNTESRKKAWSKLSIAEKEKSNAFVQHREFNTAVKHLNDLKKAELTFDITDETGKLNLKKFLKVAEEEFARMELGEHEKIFLETLKNGQLRYGLDMSPSINILQGIIMSMLERRLIKQKFPGEGLYQMSSVGFESPVKTGLTKDEEYKKGTNGLSYYHFDKNGKYQGWADVRISIQGDFEKLLNMIHPDGKKVRTVERLNEIIKDPKWLSNRNNVRMITFLSPRIPGQSKASYDVCRVKHFFGKECGPIIQGPVEWLAKKGIDFDIDKEFTLFPRITKNDRGEPLIASFTEPEIKKLWKKIRNSWKWKQSRLHPGYDESGDVKADIALIDPEVDHILSMIFEGSTENISSKIKLLSYKEFATKMNLYSAENRLVESIENILSDPASYVDLVRPNGTYYFTKLANKLAPYTLEFNTSSNVFGKDFSNPSFTKVLEIESNLYWQQAFSIGKSDLGIAAVDNAASPIFLESDAPMRPTVSIQTGTDSFPIDQVLYIPHHTVDYNGKPAISLSSLTNTEGFKTTEYSAQLISVLVDIVKNPELMTKLGINKYNFSVFSYLAIRVGTPLEVAGYFINNPLVRDYIRMKSLVNSPLASTLGIAPDVPAFYESKARDLIMQKYGLIGPGKVYNFNKKEFYNEIKEYMGAREKPEFTEEELFGQLVKKKEVDAEGKPYRPNRLDKMVLLHYLEIEDQNKDLTGLKLGLRFDTSRAKSMTIAHSRKLMLEMAKINTRYTPEMVSNTMDNSFIGAFDLEAFLEENIAPLFPVVEHKAIVDFTMHMLTDRKIFRSNMSIVGAERPAELIDGFKNDIPSFIFQNQLKGFHPGKIGSYKGLDVEKIEDIADKTTNPATGVSVTADKVYVNLSQIKEAFKLYREGKKSSEAKELKLQYPPVTALLSINEFSHFVIEREYLRSFLKQSDVNTSPYYMDSLRFIRDTMTGVSPEIAEKLAYESTLKNMSLDNIFNNWHIFESENAYALQYGRIVSYLKRNYPTVMTDYPVLGHLVPSPLGTGNVPLMWNLKQQTVILTKEDRELFHENLQKLANRSVIKIKNNLNENNRISDFFRMLPFVAMLQSSRSDTEFGLGRIIPKEDYLAFIESGFNKFKDILDRIHEHKMAPEILELAFKKYLSANNISNYQYNIRNKDLLVTNSDINYLRLSKKPEKLLAAPAQGDTYILPTNSSDVLVLAQSTPDIIYAYNGQKGNPDTLSRNSTSYDGMFGQTGITNSVGLPLYDSYSKNTKAVTDATLEKNIEIIDKWINTLVELRYSPTSPKRIQFNPNGYGQALIGADRYTGWNLDPKKATAPETFYYLSRQLKEKFGYNNKNFLEAADIVKKAALIEQNINDLARDKIIECFK